MTAGIGSADAKALLAWIKRTRRDWFRVADIGKDLRRFRDHPEDLAAALNVLKALGVIRPRLEAPDPAKPEPKPSPAYDVHPDLFGAPGITTNTTIPASEVHPELLLEAPGITTNTKIPAPEAADSSNCGDDGNSRRSQESDQSMGREVFEL